MTTSCRFRFFWAISTLCLLATIYPIAVARSEEPSSRETLLIDTDWLFEKGDPAGFEDKLTYRVTEAWMLPTADDFIAAPAARPKLPDGNPGGEVPYAQIDFDDHTWRHINLPHDWAIEGPFDTTASNETGLRHFWGVAWYRKHLEIPAADIGKDFFLDIDGAMSYATVWVNGHCAGGWPYGYASFEVDLTPFIQPGKDNVLAVRLDNPPDSSRWYPGAGIYRNVHLVKTAPVHLAHWGVQITTPKITTKSATAEIKLSVMNSLPNGSSVEAQTTLYAPTTGGLPGSAVASSEWTPMNLAPGASSSLDQKIQIPQPRLWDLDHPDLYNAVTLIRQNGSVIDRQDNAFGVRSINFAADGGFFLNGRHVALHGVCLHSDLGALGTAVYRRGLQRQIDIMKEMGVNAIRTSHNPPSPELVDLCNHMGVLMLAESFDCWNIAKKPNDYHLLFDEWSEADLRALIRHYRNNPCVILWSIGNEIPNQTDPSGVTLGKRLTAIAHEEDSTRSTTVACSDAKGGFNGYQHAVDVFGYNYKPGWYAKVHALPENVGIPILGTETASTLSSRSEYFFPPSIKVRNFQVTSYDSMVPPWATLPDTEFKGQDQNPFVAGEFVWTGFDYLGEPTPFYSKGQPKMLLKAVDPAEMPKVLEAIKNKVAIPSPSRSSYFGIVDLAGIKKDRFYLYQSRWRPELPMAHLLPHWNWPGMEGRNISVYLYTSGDEGEIFLNGHSLGRKTKAPLTYRLEWEVPYTPGTLQAVAYKDSKEWARDTVKTTGPTAKIALEPDHSTLQADGSDLSYVTIRLTDSAGLTVPTASNSVHVTVTGPADLLALDNGNATDLDSFQTSDKMAFHGYLVAIVRTKAGQPGNISVMATADGLTPAQSVLSSR